MLKKNFYCFLVILSILLFLPRSGYSLQINFYDDVQPIKNGFIQYDFYNNDKFKDKNFNDFKISSNKIMKINSDYSGEYLAEGKSLKNFDNCKVSNKIEFTFDELISEFDFSIGGVNKIWFVSLYNDENFIGSFEIENNNYNYSDYYIEVISNNSLGCIFCFNKIIFKGDGFCLKDKIIIDNLRYNKCNNLTPVSEPASILLFGFGLFGLGFIQMINLKD